MTAGDREAVIVSTARTGLAKSVRGGFNQTPPMTLAAHAIRSAVDRAGIDPASVEDVVLGNCAHSPSNIARLSALLAGLPVGVGGVTVQRHCSSGLNAVAAAAASITQYGADVVVAGGVESISLPGGVVGDDTTLDPALEAAHPAIYMTMLETADIVADRYGVTREAQDEYALASQQRTARAQAAGLFDDEIVPMRASQRVVDKETGAASCIDVVVAADDCNRPSTTLDGLAALPPVRGPGNTVTAGNASQFSDGAAALVLMSAAEASRQELTPLGAFRGWAVAGCEPDEMGIGPVVAVPRLLERHGLEVDDIDLWELNEAFASQCLYSRDALGIDPDRYNVNGGSISIGHPFGMTGARCAGHILREGIRRKARWGVVTMCIGAGQGAAGLFEIYA